MGIDDQFNKFEKLITGIYTELDKQRAEIRSLKMGDRLSFNLREAADITGYSQESLFAKCKAKKIPYTQDGPGATIIVLRRDIEAYLNAHLIGGPNLSEESSDNDRPLRISRTRHS